MAISDTKVVDGRTAGRLLLSALVEVLPALDPGFSMPKRVSMAPGGQLVEDGEQLTVLYANITRGLPGAPQSDGFVPVQQMIQFHTFEVNLIRRVHGLTGTPKPRPPSPAELDSDYDVTAADADLLWAAIVTIWAENMVTTTNRHFAFGPLAGVGVEGRLAGSRCPVSWPVLATRTS